MTVIPVGLNARDKRRVKHAANKKPGNAIARALVTNGQFRHQTVRSRKGKGSYSRKEKHRRDFDNHGGFFLFPLSLLCFGCK